MFLKRLAHSRQHSGFPWKSLPALRHPGPHPAPLSPNSSPWLSNSPHSQSLQGHTHLNCCFQFSQLPRKLASREVLAPTGHLLKCVATLSGFPGSAATSLPPDGEEGTGQWGMSLGGRRPGRGPGTALGLPLPPLQVFRGRPAMERGFPTSGGRRPGPSSGRGPWD